MAARMPREDLCRHCSIRGFYHGRPTPFPHCPPMPKIDYTPYLHVAQDGRIWWPRTIAIRLGAGFLPVCDDHQALQPELRAPHERARVNERTLIGALGDSRLQVEPPPAMHCWSVGASARTSDQRPSSGPRSPNRACWTCIQSLAAHRGPTRTTGVFPRLLRAYSRCRKYGGSRLKTSDTSRMKPQLHELKTRTLEAMNGEAAMPAP